MSAGRSAYIGDGGGADTLTTAADAPFRALLFAAPPIDEPVAFGGPFVMNTAEEIRQAFADFRGGRFFRRCKVTMTAAG